MFQVVGNHLVIRKRQEFGAGSLEFAGEALHRLRDGGTEHGARNGLGQVTADLLHVGVETHRKHLVGFVQHQVTNVQKVHVTALHMVHQAARCGYDDVNTFTEGLKLGLVGHAAKNSHRPDSRALGKLFDFVLHLDAQLAGRHKDQRLRIRMVPHNDLQKRKYVGTRLARARLGLHQHVPGGQHVGDGLALDGHQLCPAVLSQNILLFVRKLVESVVGQLVLGFDNLDRRQERIDFFLFFLFNNFFAHSECKDSYLTPTAPSGIPDRGL